MSDHSVASAITEPPAITQMTGYAVHPSGWWKASDGTWYRPLDQGTSTTGLEELLYDLAEGPEGAQAQANRVLDRDCIWLAKGHGFQARIKEGK